MEFHVSLIDRTDLRGEIYRQIRRAIVDGRAQTRRVPASEPRAGPTSECCS